MAGGGLGTRAACSPRGREGTAHQVLPWEGASPAPRGTNKPSSALSQSVPREAEKHRLRPLAYPGVLKTRLDSLSFVVIKA